MKPLPDFSDVEAMAAIGRTSALWSARNHALNELRDKYTAMQSAQFDADFVTLADQVVKIAERIAVIAALGLEDEQAKA